MVFQPFFGRLLGKRKIRLVRKEKKCISLVYFFDFIQEVMTCELAYLNEQMSTTSRMNQIKNINQPQK
jgi:hypothetical protein